VRADPILPLIAGGRVAVLDGGLASRLERLGADLHDRLWSAAVLLERPELISQAHTDYLRAGADVIITASYQASFEGFEERGIEAAAAAELMRESVRIALDARDTWWAGGVEGRPRPVVAASIGPYGAVLADGSEYRGNYGIGVDALADFHVRRLEVLTTAGADLLAVETIPSLPEAEALARCLAAFPEVPAWVSFTCGDAAHLWDGAPLAEAVEVVTGTANLVAVGVNCTAPSLVAPLVGLARGRGMPVVAYPNMGARYDATTRSWSASGAEPFAEAALSWVAAGASLVGGCCGTGPDDVKAIARIVA
jgi:homocysteine S-methyltransferase